MTTALGALGWPAASPGAGDLHAFTVVVVEADDGTPDPPRLDGVRTVVAACLGSPRSLNALIPLVRGGAVPLNADAPFGQLVRRVSWVLSSRPQLDGRLHVAVLERRRAETSALARLTPSESHVLALLAEGQTVGRIALLLDRSEHTVRSQVRAVLTKLRADSQLVAVAIARRSLERPWPVEHLHFTHFGDAADPLARR